MTFSTAHRLLAVLVSLLSVASLYAQQIEYGLHINSYPAPSQEHTTLALDEGNPIDLKGKKLTLSFDLRLRPENILGTAVRMITDNGCNIDLLFSIENDERFPNLVVGDKANLQTTVPTRCEWVPVSLTADPKNGTAELNYNGIITRADYPDLKEAESVRIAIGRSSIKGFILDDVASIDVKDVSVMLDGKPIRKWRLQGHVGDICYDEINSSIASAYNANWIVDENAKWRVISQQKFSSLPSVAFDPVIATFYIGVPDSNRLLVYHSSEGVTDTIVAKGGNHLSQYPNQLMYITPLHTVLSYSIDDNRYAFFDPIDHKWVNSGLAENDHDFWNNSVCYNPSDSSLVSFGGYGHYKYNDLLIKAFPFRKTDQQTTSLTKIHPRRSSSTVIVGDYLYIFGGRGCPSGRQELGTRNYYDLYRVNLADNSTELLWDLDKSPYDSDFTGLENMIYDADSDSFLILTTLDGGTLLRVNRKDGEMEKMTYPMDFDINSHMVYGNLFYSPEQKRYYAAIVTSQTDATTDLTIYSLPAPIVTMKSLMQQPTIPDDSGLLWKCLTTILIAISAIAAGMAIWRRRKRHIQPTLTSAPEEYEEKAKEVSPQPDMKDILPNKKDTDAPHADPESEPDGKEALHPHYDLTRSAVRLFGGFQVFDKEGNDMTSSFTPILQQLLIILILHTAKNTRGISSSRLLETLWGNKDEEAAKNNRNVYISRLRNLLQQIGDVSVNTNNGFRNIRFGEGTICDYIEAKSLIQENDPKNLDRLIELLCHGMMIPNMEFEYIDTFKSEFSNEAIEILTTLVHDREIPLKDKIKIADVIFQHDIINEDALCVKCKALHMQGRIGLAQNTYSSFRKEYRSLMGSEYPHTLNEILGSGSPTLAN